VIDHGILGDLDYIQHGARPGVRRFTPGGVVPSLSILCWVPPLVQAPMSSIGRLICHLGICLGCLRGVCDLSTRRQETQVSADVMSGKISFVDLSGAPQDELIAVLTASSFNSTYLVTPIPMYLTSPQGISSCIALKARICPHLDLNHIP
jgi:hypothetical protein